MTSGDPFDRPLFIVSSPRSGSSLLFLTMAQAPGVFTIGGESHGLIEGIPGLHPFQRGWTSNRLLAADATPAVSDALRRGFRAALRDRTGKGAEGRVRMIEKTPKNSLRVPFLKQVFPDARFLYLYRDPRETLSSMIEAWESGRFVTYPRLPGWRPLAWSLLLTPDWRALVGRPLAEVVARQWAATTAILLDDLAALPAADVAAIDYRAFLESPQQSMVALADALDLRWDRDVGHTLPLSPTVVSAPAVGKWRRHKDAILSHWAAIDPIDRRARAFLDVQRI